MSYKADGTPKTENEVVKLIHDTQEYWRFLAHLRYNGCCKAEVAKVVNLKTGEPIDDITMYQDEVDKAFNPQTEKALTPEQQQIAELKAIVADLQAGLKGSGTPSVTPASDDELAALREEYTALAGKQGDKRWTVATLQDKIAELKGEA